MGSIKRQKRKKEIKRLFSYCISFGKKTGGKNRKKEPQEHKNEQRREARMTEKGEATFETFPWRHSDLNLPSCIKYDRPFSQ